MKNWFKYGELKDLVAKSLDRAEADQTEPSFARVFDVMVAICSVAGPEETLNELNGDFSSVGHLVVYEDWSDDGRTAQSTVECDGWVLTTLQNDGGYTISKIGDWEQTMNFSHDEPDWEPRTLALLERTYWLPLSMESLLTI